MVGIYKITSPSGKVYIGQSWDIQNRFWRYNSSYPLRQNGLRNSFKKYGVKNHAFEIAHELPVDVSQDVMNTYEQLYMDQYRDCGIKLLNCKEAGANGKLSEETKQRIAKAQTGTKHTEETKKKMSAWQIGKIVSDKTKQKIGEANSGRVHTEESKAKISAGGKGRIVSEEGRKNISKGLSGKLKSDEHKKKLSEAAKIAQKGENNSRSKLTEDQVRQIRKSYVPGLSRTNRKSLREIANEFGVSKSCARDIIYGKIWAHVI